VPHANPSLPPDVQARTERAADRRREVRAVAALLRGAADQSYRLLHGARRKATGWHTAPVTGHTEVSCARCGTAPASADHALRIVRGRGETALPLCPACRGLLDRAPADFWSRLQW